MYQHNERQRCGFFSFPYLAVFISETDPAQPKTHPAGQCEDNQNHAIIFLRGIFSQCIDANQGGYFEQMPGWGEIKWAGFFQPFRWDRQRTHFAGPTFRF